jgi:hypothetical protein
MQIATANNQLVPAPVRAAKAAEAVPTVKGVGDTFQRTVALTEPSLAHKVALYSAAATLVAGVILGVLGRPGMAIACVLSAAVDGVVAFFTRR